MQDVPALWDVAGRLRDTSRFNAIYVPKEVYAKDNLGYFEIIGNKEMAFEVLALGNGCFKGDQSSENDKRHFHGSL